MYDMPHDLSVRRIFEERARLVVYVESSSADAMEKRARSEGKTLVEWMRETLLGELEDSTEVRPVREVSVARRSTPAPERREQRRHTGTLGHVEDVTHQAIRELPLSGMASDAHSNGCGCGVCRFKREAMK
jgi:hypothetical protein